VRCSVAILITILVVVYVLWRLWGALFGGGQGAATRPQSSGWSEEDLRRPSGDISESVARVRLPSVAAQSRLSGEILRLEKELATLGAGNQSERLSKEIDRQCEEWVMRELSGISLALLDIPGVGPKGFEALRSAGYSSLADVQHLQAGGVSGFGEKKVSELREMLRRERKAAEERFGRLSPAELNAESGGRVREVSHKAQEDGRRAARKRRQLELQLYELRRRLAVLSQEDGGSAHE
jgi:hypothetical protein